MPTIKVYVTAEQSATIQEYAAADMRSVSNLIKHVIAGHMTRCKKRDKDNRIIVFPDSV